MAISSAAQQAEIKAFKAVSKALGEPKAFAQPAGFETSFPDFGFRVILGGKKVDLHIEYKADAKAQMGSMRDWIFDGNKFSTPSTSEEKQDLIDIMNSSDECKRNGKRILKDFQTYADPKIKKIYSGMMTIESNKDIRRAKLVAFKEATNNFQLAKIDNTTLGDAIINHYKKKFAKSIKPDADASILMMMIGDQIWYISTNKTVTRAMHDQLGTYFSKNVPQLPDLRAALEVRIQPRGLSAPGKPVSVDVMASFRLSGKLAGGATI